MARYLIILFISSNSLAQSQINNQQFWLDFYPHYEINENLEYYGDAGIRTVLNEFSWTRFYVRPSIRFHKSDLWQFHAGIGFFYFDSESDYDRFEFRPWQDVRLNWPKFGDLKIINRLRAEERFSYIIKNDWESSWEFRLRYKISTNWKFLKSDKNWFIPIYVEAFFPVLDQVEEFFQNKMRAGTGIGYLQKGSWKYAILYNFQYSRLGPDETLELNESAFQIKIWKYW